ncbi:PhzF family phenazine biosynthesis protein [Halalkalicoccus jeotgali]|uniref:Phenazine biosynthesis protein PhzF family n=1 Tax=Halalkalicoccus jeotgali (strain DSM 18796 / CECT 7217 / JCM 14584 / KCTC 4019 / B3) TaxID=795797 RepID=D8J751_HALJB|nr:PhzF family phenazine biosynthesis protein [Halalkalicoccus jeotgali]ADJ16004.1 phenazine biosynthesis protein PhzF family [Halalkalicoccus jeotgali B3]ELY38100.1 phenazine biosynthesis protein PhzF family [Halalkalicoccus jeotgali B3]
MERRVHLIDAFTGDPLAGNAAGVVPDAGELSDEQRQAIARELAVSETAFLSDSERADRRIRYFTPTTEVDLCGHATIASHAHLFEAGTLDAGTHTLETNVGVLDIEVRSDGTVWMEQDDPRIERVDPDYETVAESLSIDRAALEDVGADLPLAVSSTGFPVLVVPVNFLEHLGNADPDDGAVAELCESVGAMGIYAFTFDTLTPAATLHGRMFAPRAGIAEDPVTGTASGAAGAYLREFDAFGPSEFPEEMHFEQGHFVDRPGEVRVRVGGTVRVGGRAVKALSGTLSVPDRGTDGIVEA